MSYLFTALIPGPEVPSAARAREYILEGALFNTQPKVSYRISPNGEFEDMTLKFDPNKQSIVLRRLSGEDAEAARAEVIDQALACGQQGEDIANDIHDASVVLEWEVERSELDEDAWFALHLWQAWILGASGGWLYAPGDGIFDTKLARRCVSR